jgi:hypothetical protein
MRAVLWFRVVAIILLLFAVGHTYGFLAFRPPTAEGRAVWDAMNNVHFSVGRSTFSYGGFYKGFGLSISAFQLFSAWLAWTLGSMARRGIPGVRAIAWGLFFLQVVGLVLSVRYFAIVPAVLSAIAALCIFQAARSIRGPSLASE